VNSFSIKGEAKMAELIVPITEDLRTEDSRMDIIKGIEKLNPKDEVMTSAVAAAGCSAGDWLVKGANGLELAGGTAVANTYPVWVGNDQLDAVASGKATILVGGHYIYRTTKYVAGSYTAGMNLTVKDTGGTSAKLLQAAGGTDPILARVYTAPDSKSVMEVRVLDR
jgi:hypothetical protein